MNNTYLVHHGVKGMKWGVRRYENFNGSLTRAGLSRYNKSLDKYNRSVKDYNDAKIRRKNDGNVSRQDLKYLKSKTKVAKTEMKKHYNHLSEDMRADKGKVRYKNGERIRVNDKAGRILRNVGVVTMSAASAALKNQLIDDKASKIIAGIGAITTVSGIGYNISKQPANRQLRSYYRHTSNY